MDPIHLEETLFLLCNKNTGAVKLLTMLLIITSWERHESAPYLRLKNSKSVKTFKVSNSQKEYQTNEKPKRPIWRAKRGTLSPLLTSIVAKHQKIEGGPVYEKKMKNVSQCRKN